jgi:beta-lactamase regulating signal transducer with metallopeptidase domain
MLATIIEAAFRSFVLWAVIWAGVRILRVKGARSHKAVWVTALLSALLMPLLMQWHTVKFSPPVARQGVSEAIRAVPHQMSRLAAPIRRMVAPREPVVMSSSPGRMDWRAAFIGGTTVVYLATAAVLLLRLLIGVVLALRLWRRAKPVPADWANGARVRITGAINMPVAIGSGVLLPAEAKEWDEARLRTVIAHERCHVNQGDFYIQLLAGLHTAIFWFSPMSWWLQRELSDLGETISDEAGWRQAEDRPWYAELLLEIARGSDRNLAGVAMARSGNIGRRIERILSEAGVGTAFTWKRGLALAAVLVPLVAIAAGLTPSFSAPERLEAPIPAAPPATQAAPNVRVQPQPPAAPVPPEPADTNWSWFSDGADESYAITAGNQLTIMNGSSSDADRVRRYQSKIHGDFIWFTRGGKSYTIDDPDLVRQAKALFKPQEELGRKQAVLGEQQAKLGEEQEKLGQQQAEVSIPAPELDKKLQELEAQIDAMRTRMRSLKNQHVQQDDLSAIQEQIGALQEELGAAQGKLGDMQGQLGEKQGKLGEEQEKLGEEQEKLGEQQEKLAEEATSKLKSLIDQAVRDRKAKPAD